MTQALWPFKKVALSLVCALVMFLLTLLCLESFTFIVAKVGTDLNVAPAQFSLISSIPTIFLGVGSFIYASLADFVKLKYIFWTGFCCLMLGSVCGFFFHAELWQVIFARSLQTFGGEAGGSVFLVLTARYLNGRARVISYGIFTAGFQLGIGSGVFAGGAFSTLDWRMLFLFPLATLLVAPVALWALPKGIAGEEARQAGEEAQQTTVAKRRQGLPVDVVGFALFVTFSSSLLLFFSFRNWIYIALSCVAIVLFAIYITHAKEPFILPQFFKNTLWIGLSAVLFCFWFPNLSITTTCNNFAAEVFHISSSEAALLLLAPIISAVLMGLVSGPIVVRMGRKATIALAGACELGGFLLSAFCMHVSPWMVSASLCLYYAGVSLIYSPLVDSIVGVLHKDEAGRGLGLIDLTINVSSSVGYAVFVPLLQTSTQSSGFFDASPAVHFSAVFCLFASCSALALVLFLLQWKRVRA